MEENTQSRIQRGSFANQPISMTAHKEAKNRMSLPITIFPDQTLERVLEVITPRPPVSEHAAARPRLQSKPSLPSRIAVIGNYLPRQCGIATFTTDLCAAISAEYGTARLLALPVNDTGSWI